MRKITNTIITTKYFNIFCRHCYFQYAEKSDFSYFFWKMIFHMKNDICLGPREKSGECPVWVWYFLGRRQSCEGTHSSTKRKWLNGL
jgi:hypothetical protein